MVASETDPLSYTFRPMDNERNAMPRLISVRLVSSINASRLMTHRIKLIKFSPRRTSIIAGENEDGIISDPALLQSIHYLTHVPVDLLHEIAIVVRPASSLEFFYGQNRCVRAG